MTPADKLQQLQADPMETAVQSFKAIRANPTEFIVGRSQFAEAETQALAKYKGFGFSSINQALRHSPAALAEEGRQVVGTLDALTHAARVEKEFSVWRGFGSHPALQGGGNLVGREFTDAGFTSTSLNPYVAETFAQGKDAFLAEIRMKPGAKGFLLSSHQVWRQGDKEAEFLLPRGTKFKVLEELPAQTSYGPRRLVLEAITPEAPPTPLQLGKQVAHEVRPTARTGAAAARTMASRGTLNELHTNLESKTGQFLKRVMRLPFAKRSRWHRGLAVTFAAMTFYGALGFSGARIINEPVGLPSPVRMAVRHGVEYATYSPEVSRLAGAGKEAHYRELTQPGAHAKFRLQMRRTFGMDMPEMTYVGLGRQAEGVPSWQKRQKALEEWILSAGHYGDPTIGIEPSKLDKYGAFADNPEMRGLRNIFRRAEKRGIQIRARFASEANLRSNQYSVLASEAAMQEYRQAARWFRDYMPRNVKMVFSPSINPVSRATLRGNPKPLETVLRMWDPEVYDYVGGTLYSTHTETLSDLYRPYHQAMQKVAPNKGFAIDELGAPLARKSDMIDFLTKVEAGEFAQLKRITFFSRELNPGATARVGLYGFVEPGQTESYLKPFLTEGLPIARTVRPGALRAGPALGEIATDLGRGGHIPAGVAGLSGLGFLIGRLFRRRRRNQLTDELDDLAANTLADVVPTLTSTRAPVRATGIPVQSRALPTTVASARAPFALPARFQGESPHRLPTTLPGDRQPFTLTRGPVPVVRSRPIPATVPSGRAPLVLTKGPLPVLTPRAIPATIPATIPSMRAPFTLRKTPTDVVPVSTVPQQIRLDTPTTSRAPADIVQEIEQEIQKEIVQPKPEQILEAARETHPPVSTAPKATPAKPVSPAPVTSSVKRGADAIAENVEARAVARFNAKGLAGIVMGGAVIAGGLMLATGRRSAENPRADAGPNDLSVSMTRTGDRREEATSHIPAARPPARVRTQLTLSDHDLNMPQLDEAFARYVRTGTAYAQG